MRILPHGGSLSFEFSLMGAIIFDDPLTAPSFTCDHGSMLLKSGESFPFTRAQVRAKRARLVQGSWPRRLAPVLPAYVY